MPTYKKEVCYVKHLSILVAATLLISPGAAVAADEAAVTNVPTVTPAESVHPELGDVDQTDLSAEYQDRLKRYAEYINETPERTLELLQGYAKANEVSVESSLDLFSQVLDGDVGEKAESKQTYITLPAAKHAGDVYYTPAGIWVIDIHGHVGLYDEKDYIIESGKAEGRKGVYRIRRKKIQVVRKGTKRMYLKLGPRGPRHVAAAHEALLRGNIWAKSKRPYNKNFLDNKHEHGNAPDYSFNCSQLVWSAFKPHADLDVDPSNRQRVKTDSATMPWEIRDHTWMQHY